MVDWWCLVLMFSHLSCYLPKPEFSPSPPPSLYLSIFKTESYIAQGWPQTVKYLVVTLKLLILLPQAPY